MREIFLWFVMTTFIYNCMHKSINSPVLIVENQTKNTGLEIHFKKIYTETRMVALNCGRHAFELKRIELKIQHHHEKRDIRCKHMLVFSPLNFQ